METRNAAPIHTVLVVEDEPLIRFCAVSLLEDAGYRVLEAANGREALAWLAADHDIELLFTDVHMPGTPDGLELAGIVAHDYPRVRALVASGKAALSSAMIPGGGLFLIKPYSPDQVTQCLAKLLAA